MSIESGSKKIQIYLMLQDKVVFVGGVLFTLNKDLRPVFENGMMEEKGFIVKYFF